MSATLALFFDYPRFLELPEVDDAMGWLDAVHLYETKYIPDCLPPNKEFAAHADWLYRTAANGGKQCNLDEWLHPVTVDLVQDLLFMPGKKEDLGARRQIFQKNLAAFATYFPSELETLVGFEHLVTRGKILSAMSSNRDYVLSADATRELESMIAPGSTYAQNPETLKTSVMLLTHSYFMREGPDGAEGGSGEYSTAFGRLVQFAKAEASGVAKEGIITQFTRDVPFLKVAGESALFTMLETLLSEDALGTALAKALVEAHASYGTIVGQAALPYFEPLLDDGSYRQKAAAAVGSILVTRIGLADVNHPDFAQHFSEIEQHVYRLVDKTGTLPSHLLEAILDFYQKDTHYFQSLIIDLVATDKKIPHGLLKKLMVPIATMENPHHALFIALRLAQQDIPLPMQTLQSLAGQLGSDEKTALRGVELFYHLRDARSAEGVPVQTLLTSPEMVGSLTALYEKILPNPTPNMQARIKALLPTVTLTSPHADQSQELQEQSARIRLQKEGIIPDIGLSSSDQLAFQVSMEALLRRGGWSAVFLEQCITETENSRWLLLISALEMLANYGVSSENLDRNAVSVVDILQKEAAEYWLPAIRRVIADNHFFIAKEVDSLLQEMREENQSNARVLALIENHYLRDKLEAIMQIQMDGVEVGGLHTHLQDWQKEDFLQWRKGVHTIDDSNIAEVIAVLAEALHQTVFHHKYYPRPAQLLSVLILFASEKGGLLQIGTGEGKSVIVALFAAIQVLSGRKVDIVTSDEELATRDLEEQAPFYHQLGITASHNIDGSTGPKACYHADVVYGDLLNWIGDTLRDITNNIKLGRGFDLVIVDEVDSMFIDQNNMKVQLSNAIPGFEMLRQMFVYMFGTTVFAASMLEQTDATHCTVRRPVLTEAEKAMLEKLDPEAVREGDEDFERVTVAEHCMEYLREYITGYTREHLFNFTSVPEARQVVVPRHLEVFVGDHLPNWVESLLQALYYFEEKTHYIAYEPPEDRRWGHKGKIITPIDKDTGVIQLGLRWGDGLHPFLEMKHSLTLHAESLISVFMSYYGYFLKYKGSIYGMTGTLGGEAEQRFLQEVYKVDLALVPFYVHKDLTQFPARILPTREAWQEEISGVLTRQICHSRASLVVLDTIREVEELRARLELEGCQFFVYGTGAKEEYPIKSKRELQPGDVIIATNRAGRGMDLLLSQTVLKNGGLHVIVGSFPDNLRVEYQEIGRGARNGEPGSTQLILNQETLPKTTCETDIECLIDARAKQNKQQLEEDRLCRLPAIELRDLLFERYVALVKRMHSPTGYLLELLPPIPPDARPEGAGKDTIQETVTLTEENGAILLTLVNKEGTRRVLDITAWVETIDPQAAAHMRTIITNPRSTESSLNRQDYELAHFLIAREGWSQVPIIYERVLKAFTRKIQNDIPQAWLETHTHPDYWGNYARSESLYLQYMYEKDAEFADLRAQNGPAPADTPNPAANAGPGPDPIPNPALLAQVKLRLLYRLWCADRNLYTNEFEVKQITEYWAIWLKTQDPYLQEYALCSIETEADRAEMEARQARIKEVLITALMQWGEEKLGAWKEENTSKESAPPHFMQNPTYLIQKAWKRLEIYDDQQWMREEAAAKEAWGWMNPLSYFSNAAKEALQHLWSGMWGFVYHNYVSMDPLNEAIIFLEKAIAREPLYSWAAYNALSYMRLKGVSGITQMEDAQIAMDVKQKFGRDASAALQHVLDWVIPQWEGQLSFLLIHQQVAPHDPLAVQLIGGIQVWQKVTEALHRNLETLQQVQPTQMIRLGNFLKPDSLTKEVNMTEVILRTMNLTDASKIGRELLKKITHAADESSHALVVNEIMDMGGFLFEIEVYDLEEEEENWFGTVFSAVFGVVQIFMGVSLIAMGGVFGATLGMSFMMQGIGDVFSSIAAVANHAPIVMDHYIKSKGMAIGVALVTAGLLHGLGAVTGLGVETAGKLTKFAVDAPALLAVQMAGVQLAMAGVGAALYQVAKPLGKADKEEIEAATRALVQACDAALRQILATDAWNRHYAPFAHHDILSEVMEYVNAIIHDYEKGTSGGDAFAESVGWNLLGAVAGSGVSARAKALVGGIKAGDALGSITQKVTQMIQEMARKKTLTTGEMFSQKLKRDFPALADEMVTALLEQGYLRSGEIEVQQCGRLKEVRLPGAAHLSHKSLVGTCDQVAALVHAEYRAEIEQFRVSLDRSLSKSVTRLQSGVVKTVTEYAAAPISEALTERSIRWVVMQMEETKERQQAAQAADMQAKLPPRHTRDTAQTIAQTQPKQPADVPSAAMPGTPPSTTPAVTPGDAPQHQVKPHDNLHKIAKQYGTTAEALKSANPQLANPDLIYPGQMLNLPAGSMMPPFQAPVPANHNVPPSSGLSMSWGTCPVPDVEDPWNRPAYGILLTPAADPRQHVMAFLETLENEPAGTMAPSAQKNPRFEAQMQRLVTDLYAEFEKSEARGGMLMIRRADQYYIVGKFGVKALIIDGKEQFATYFPNAYDTLAVAADALGETVVGFIRKADGRFQQAFGKGYDQFKEKTGNLLTAIDRVAPEFVQDGAVMLTGYGLAKGAGAAAGMATAPVVKLLKKIDMPDVHYHGDIRLDGIISPAGRDFFDHLYTHEQLDASIVNQQIKLHYKKPPFMPGTKVTAFKTEPEMKFVRLYDATLLEGKIPKIEGHFVALEADVRGLSAQQLKDKFDLPRLPTHIVDVTPPAGTEMLVGVVKAENFGGAGKGTQFYFRGKVLESWFIKRGEIP